MDFTTYGTATKVHALNKYGGVTPRRFVFLVNRFGSLDSLLQANQENLSQIEGLSTDDARKIAETSKFLDKSQDYLKELVERDIKVTTRFDSDYPARLLELNDPPPLLYYRGSLPDPDKKIVSLAGTQKPTSLGIELTTKLAKTFAAADIQVVSSFHGGIDMAAHLGSKSEKGASFAIVNGGFDNINLTEDMPVALDLLEKGGLLSENEPSVKASKDSYKMANRLLVGIGQAVVITEHYGNSQNTRDLLEFCQMIGKLVFYMIDPEHGAHADEDSLGHALEMGAIPVEGFEKVDYILKSLV